jgi:hypothetical protein
MPGEVFSDGTANRLGLGNPDPSLQRLETDEQFVVEIEVDALPSHQRNYTPTYITFRIRTAVWRDSAHDAAAGECE